MKLVGHKPEWHCPEHPSAIVNTFETETLRGSRSEMKEDALSEN